MLQCDCFLLHIKTQTNSVHISGGFREQCLNNLTAAGGKDVQRCSFELCMWSIQSLKELSSAARVSCRGREAFFLSEDRERALLSPHTSVISIEHPKIECAAPTDHRKRPSAR